MNYTPEEQKLIDWLERYTGKETASQQKHLSLAQARQTGDMDERTEAGVRKFGKSVRSKLSNPDKFRFASKP
jgi:hypothetical protein